VLQLFYACAPSGCLPRYASTYDWEGDLSFPGKKDSVAGPEVAQMPQRHLCSGMMTTYRGSTPMPSPIAPAPASLFLKVVRAGFSFVLPTHPVRCGSGICVAFARERDGLPCPVPSTGPDAFRASSPVPHAEVTFSAALDLRSFPDALAVHIKQSTRLADVSTRGTWANSRCLPGG
jgi:hypothetical protein